MRATAFSSPTLDSLRTPLQASPCLGEAWYRPSSLELVATTNAVHPLACLEPRASRVLIYRNVVISLARRHKGSRRKPVGASSLTMAARGCAHVAPRYVCHEPLPAQELCPHSWVASQAGRALWPLLPLFGSANKNQTSSDYIFCLGLDPLLLRTCSPPVSGRFGYSFCASGSRLPSGTLEVVHSLLRPGTRAKFALLASQHSS